MKRYVFTHLADARLCAVLRSFLAHEQRSEALLLAYLSEFDARRLYLPAAHPSMYAYCLHELHMSEDMAAKRIRVARAARDFPALFHGIAQGHLHLSGIMLFAPHLAAANAERIIALARHRTCDEIRLMLAREFPAPDLETLVEPIPSAAPVPVAASSAETPGILPASKRVEFLENSPVAEGAAVAGMPPPTRPTQPLLPARDRLAPLAPQRFALQVTLPQATHDKLLRAQELLGHAVAAGDLAQVLDRALEALIGALERKRFAATDAPRRQRRVTRNPRHIPAHVRREVWKRDGGRCTFTGPDGRRCESRRGLEYDHVTPVAQGGDGCASNLRLRCRGHNQLEADRVLGRPLMDAQREAARQRAAANRERRAAAAAGQARAIAAAEEAIPWLRTRRRSGDDASETQGEPPGSA